MSVEVKPRHLPRTFQSLKTLHVLNVASVGLALAGVTGSVFAHSWGASANFGVMGVIVGVPTFVFGTLWAELLRVRATVGNSRIRWGWLASIPLAILNGAAACGLLMLSDGFGGDSHLATFLLGALLGATIGAIFWVPGLVLTLTFFGLPIAWSQKLAAKGLAGEERGEIVIGVVSAVLATVGLFMTAARGEPVAPNPTVLESVGYVLLWLFGMGGVLAGACAALLARRREERRRRFVREVEAGNVSGFRVDEAPEGKVLVRVTSMGEGYRVANFEEAVYALDEEGEAKRATSALP
jgi:hypothetical protein